MSRPQRFGRKHPAVVQNGFSTDTDSRNDRADSEKVKPSLLLITGWAHGKEAMQPLAEALAGDFSVRIRTGSQALEERSIPDADYIITGSMGGLLALEFLPQSCRKLVLISSTARFCATEGYPCGIPERVLHRMITQLKRSPAKVLDEFFKQVHHPFKADAVNAPAPPSGPTVDLLVKGLEYLRDTDLRTKIPDMGIPVLLLHGAEDQIIPPIASEWLHRHLPESHLRIFENGSHALLAHDFKEVLAEILKFLQPRPKPGS